MDKEEIKDYLKRVDELGTKLTGEDEETYDWLIYGYNQCAKLLNETEQQCQKQKEVIDKTMDIINDYLKEDYSIYTENEIEVDLIVKLKNMLKEVSE